MKIGVDIRCLMESRYSGISEYTYNLLNQLFHIDSTNQYVLFYNSAQAVRVPEFNFRNVTIKEFRYPNKLFNLAMRFLKITEVDQLLGGVDIFLVPNFLFLNLSKKVKKVLIVHDLSFELYPEFFTAKKRLWHRLIGPKRLCEQADHVIAISTNTKRDLIEQYGINSNKISVVLPGIHDQFFQPLNQAQLDVVKKKYHLPERYIFALGNLEPRKNISALITAFEQLNDPSCYLVIAGAQGWKYKKMYRHWQTSAVRDRILFLGYVDTADKPSLYRLAQLFVYPSIYEGFGLPPIEAAAVGTPVVTSFAASLPEAGQDAAIMVDPYNTNELAQVIKQLLGAPTLAAQLGRQGMARGKAINWQTAAKKILTIIEQTAV